MASANNSTPTSSSCVILALIGLPGSGKSSFAKAFKNHILGLDSKKKARVIHVCYDALVPLERQAQMASAVADSKVSATTDRGMSVVTDGSHGGTGVKSKASAVNDRNMSAVTQCHGASSNVTPVVAGSSATAEDDSNGLSISDNNNGTAGDSNVPVESGEASRSVSKASTVGDSRVSAVDDSNDALSISDSKWKTVRGDILKSLELILAKRVGTSANMKSEAKSSSDPKTCPSSVENEILEKTNNLKEDGSENISEHEVLDEKSEELSLKECPMNGKVDEAIKNKDDSKNTSDNLEYLPLLEELFKDDEDMEDRDDSEDILVIVDDNNYYRSMRQDYFQLAKRLQIGFCQLHFHMDLEQALAVNLERGAGERLPEIVIRNMGKALK